MWCGVVCVEGGGWGQEPRPPQLNPFTHQLARAGRGARTEWGETLERGQKVLLLVHLLGEGDRAGCGVGVSWLRR